MAVEPPRREAPEDDSQPASAEAYNPWSVVNVVFNHLSAQGLHPTLGVGGDPGPPAAELLRCLGIEARAEGDRRVQREVREKLDELRSAVLGDPGS